MNDGLSLMMINSNRAPYLKAALDSVLQQTDNNWELIIVDDNSQDGSLEIIEKYLTDERIRLINQKKRLGIVLSRLEAIRSSRYGIIGIIDSDDVLDKRAVEVMRKQHDSHKNGLIYSQMMICDQDLKPQIRANGPIKENSSNLIDNVISHFITFKKSAYYQTAGYSPVFNRCAEDKDLFYKLEEIDDPIFVPEILYYYRLNPLSVSNYGIKKIWGRCLYFLAKLQAYKRRRQNHSAKQVRFWQILPGLNKIRPNK